MRIATEDQLRRSSRGWPPGRRLGSAKGRGSPGASENASSATALLADLVERGVDPKRRHLFVIDGSKALWAAVNRVFGSGQPVQRCRQHKIKNVCHKLPDDLSDQVKSVMKAAYALPWQEGMARLKKQADWLETHYPGAAAGLREGLEETFTINRLELSPTLRRCPGTINIIESPHARVRLRTNRVSRYFWMILLAAF